MCFRLGSVVACTHIAHLNSTWTVCCLLVWGTGWMTAETTGAFSGLTKSPQRGVVKEMKGKETYNCL